VVWFVFSPAVDRERSFKHFCLEMSSRIGPRMKLYGYDLDETAQAVVPFYTGRTFVPLSSEAELSALARDPAGEVAVITVDVRQHPWHSDQVRSRFPHAWLLAPDDGRRRMQLFSNVPGP
jgi:hypothetical protein